MSDPWSTIADRSSDSYPSYACSVRRIFVTGASTWTGGQLIRRLEARSDVEVYAVDDIDPVVSFNSPFEKLSLERLSLARYMLEVEPDTIMHLQSVHHTAEEGRNTSADERVVGALALFGAIDRLDSVRSVIVKSDTAFYGSSPRNPSVMKETTRPQGTPSKFQRDLTEMEHFVTDVAQRHTKVTYTILRFAPIFGQNVGNPLSRYLNLKVVPTMMGFDPRLQLTHEDDAVSALEHALDADVEGTFNVAGGGQIYLSRLLRLGRRIPQPLPGRLYESAMRGLTRANVSVPTHLQTYLKHGRVVDTSLMRSTLGYEPAHTCRETVLSRYGITGQGDR
jgi:UDP-glucose 4-epimerase